MKKNSLETLFVDSLKDLYDAEHQIMDALPKMTRQAKSKDLQEGLKQHLETTRRQVDRLEKVFSLVEKSPSRKKCVGMEGLIKEGEHHIEEMKNDQEVLDAVILASAQKVEHYEIAGYGTVKQYAVMLGYDQAAKLLDETLSEEYAADKKLTTLAESQVNEKAIK